MQRTEDKLNEFLLALFQHPKTEKFPQAVRFKKQNFEFPTKLRIQHVNNRLIDCKGDGQFATRLWKALLIYYSAIFIFYCLLSLQTEQPSSAGPISPQSVKWSSFSTKLHSCIHSWITSLSRDGSIIMINSLQEEILTGRLDILFFYTAV